MGLIERLEAKRREVDRLVIDELRREGLHYFWLTELRQLLDEVSVAVQPNIKVVEHIKPLPSPFYMVPDSHV